MKKTLIKRVCLVTPTGERIYSTDDYLYKIHYEGNTIQHYRYEVYTVTQYTKSWYNTLLDAVRRI